jgi:hypothetical protein
MTTTTSRLVGMVSLVAILGAGVAVGIAVDRRWLRPAAEKRVEVKAPRLGDPGHDERKIARFQERLSLDPGQTEAVGRAIREMSSEVKAIRRKVAPEMKAVRERARTRIEAVLSPEQRTRYAEMTREYEARRKSRGY